MLEWETFSNVNSKSSQECQNQCKYKLEACRLRSSESWITINADVETITDGGEDSNDTRRFCTVHSLKQGETYTFRVIAIANSISGSNGQRSDICSEPSPPSNPLTIPLGDIPLGGNVGATSQGALSSRRSSTSSGSGSCSTAGSLHESLDSCWKRDFERRYIELEELGRGRFSVVRKCQEILTGQEVAVKFINRRKQTRDETRKEYEILAMIGNERSCTVPSCLIRSSGLFLTATSDAIVMNL